MRAMVRCNAGGGRLLVAEHTLTAHDLKPCLRCGEKDGELKRSELPSRFPWNVVCKACGFTTESVKLRGIAVKLWNEAKMGKSKARRRI